MAKTTENDKSSQTPSAAEAEMARIRRRRLFIGGVGAAPVVMSLPSRALATSYCGLGGVAPFSASMATSANLSQTNTRVTSTGQGPDYWKLLETTWPSTIPNRSSLKFNDDVFGSDPPMNTNPNSKNAKLDDVISSTISSWRFARVCAASYLNARSGRYPVDAVNGNWLPPATVVAMYQGGIGSGYLVPGTGVTWQLFTIQTYLVGTWAGSCTVV